VSPSSKPVDPRLRTTRKPKQVSRDTATIHAILDDALVAHVAFVRDSHPVVIPTLLARDGDRLYLHGSSAGRMLRDLSTGIDVCIAVTLLDGLVLARSAFEQNVNYRSVVMYGTATLIDDPDEKYVALEKLTNQLIPGRWDDCRLPSPQELKGTSIFSFPIDHVSAKIRSGGPTENPKDLGLHHWAGTVPRRVVWGPPEPERDLAPDADPVPKAVLEYSRQGS
jgi:nitroimidazol reductase NimA-like FMN-containing flavoprotein (pyridoxamine 5'-phosphate oxidase superfamily)